jgi:hypothetical protein
MTANLNRLRQRLCPRAQTLKERPAWPGFSGQVRAKFPGLVPGLENETAIG